MLLRRKIKPVIHYRKRKPRRVFGLVKLAAFLVVAACAIWFGFQYVLQNNLARVIESDLQQRVGHLNAKVSLGQARFLPGTGIQLNQLSLQLSPTESNTTSSLRVYEAFIHSNADEVDLALSNLEVEKIEIRRAKVRLVQTPSGQWDFESLLNSLPLPASDKEFVTPISLVDSEFELVLNRPGHSTAPIRLSDVDLFIRPIEYKQRPLLQITGKLQSAAISDVQFTTFLDQKQGVWQTSVHANRATITKALLNFVPPEFADITSDVKRASAEVDLNLKATGTLPLQDIPEFELIANIQKLSLVKPSLPVDVFETSATVTLNNQGIKIENASGQMGQGSFNVDYEQSGLIERGTWSCSGRVEDFNYQHAPRMHNWFTENCKKFCRDFRPRGTSNIEFDLKGFGREFKKNVRCELTGMQFTYTKFPYPIENCTGSVQIVNDDCLFDLRSITSEQPVGIKGSIENIGPNSTYDINLSLAGEVPFDSKLTYAMKAHPKIAKVIQAFNPQGSVGGIGRIEKRTPQGVVHKSFDIRLKNCSINHNSFDYPINNVSGLVQTRDQEFTFSDLTGINQTGRVGCNGTWDPQNGLDLKFLCTSVPMDDQLRYALKPELREIWNGFRPQGTLDFARVSMKLPVGTKTPEIEVEADLRPVGEQQGFANTISIYPEWFPYKIQNLTGKIYIGQGKVLLKDLKGRHQRTWIVCQGNGRYSETAWSVRLSDMLVGSLKVDEDLLTALPGRLGAPVRELKYDGLLNVSGEITIAGKKQIKRRSFQSQSTTSTSNRKTQVTTSKNEPSTNLAWNLRFDMNQANMQIGLPIKNVFGMLTIVGQFDGKLASCKGDLHLDSMMLEDAQITNVRGPIWIDGERAGVGIFAEPGPSQASSLSPVSTEKKQSLTGTMQRGQVTFDAQTTFGPNGKFYLQSQLSNGCLHSACRELAPNMKDIKGISHGFIRMNGDYTGSHSYRGDGKIQLRDAKIYELPVFLSLLKVLHVRQANRTAFDSSDIDFSITGETIDFNRMEFIGDAISLIGNGRMTLDRDIDLNFYSVMGRNRIHIPVLSDIYKASAQKILWINVDGKLDNPQTHHQVLPQLNDSLKQLFNPRDASPSTASRFRNLR